jgi:hypothetical protein
VATGESAHLSTHRVPPDDDWKEHASILALSGNNDIVEEDTPYSLSWVIYQKKVVVDEIEVF